MGESVCAPKERGGAKGFINVLLLSLVCVD